MKKDLLAVGVCCTLACSTAAAAGTDALGAARDLALQLVAEESHKAAAVEFRRMALLSEDPAGVGGFFWAAAYEYHAADEHQLAARMLDACEERSPGLRAEALLLRAESALAEGDDEEAEFYLRSLQSRAGEGDAALYTRLRLARALSGQKRTSEAISLLEGSTGTCADARQAIAAYERGRDKTPWVGGVLGAVLPGLGHAYSGEYANGLRALLLNALFIYGMVETADAEAWGGFAVISFFELTWYTGGIYGGVDAAQRHNRRRMNECLQAIDECAEMKADLKTVPAVTLTFGF
ncbi:MAG: hypothetical protein FJ224_11390 [Lentisphaerae bacterium]|nr:hypothetical protein [Lentisphaerota bacterium]